MHAVAKNNRSLTDYKWLCDIDKAKGLEIGETYLNEKSALVFLSCIADTEKDKTLDLMKTANCFSFLMDCPTDISWNEQEAIYIRVSLHGVVQERFMAIGSPKSTSSKDLYDFVMETFDSYGIEKGL